MIAAIPLLAETGVAAAYAWLDRVLVVDAPVAVQHARLVARDGIDLALADRMISAQAGRERRLTLATDVVVNDTDIEALLAPVTRLDRIFRSRAVAQ